MVGLGLGRKKLVFIERLVCVSLVLGILYIILLNVGIVLVCRWVDWSLESMIFVLGYIELRLEIRFVDFLFGSFFRFEFGVEGRGGVCFGEWGGGWGCVFGIFFVEVRGLK